MSKTYVMDHMREGLAKHELALVAETDGPFPIKAFRLRKVNKTRMMSTVLLFTPEGIVIMGDLTPERHGSISNLGYGLEWFAGKLSEDYLCEKFLGTTWVPELVKPHLEELKHLDAEDPDYYRNSEGLGLTEAIDRMIKEAWVDDVPDGLSQDEYQHVVVPVLQEFGFDCETIWPGYHYDRAEAGWLCAIQQRFAELYHARNGEFTVESP